MPSLSLVYIHPCGYASSGRFAPPFQMVPVMVCVWVGKRISRLTAGEKEGQFTGVRDTARAVGQPPAGQGGPQPEGMTMSVSTAQGEGSGLRNHLLTCGSVAERVVL